MGTRDGSDPALTKALLVISWCSLEPQRSMRVCTWTLGASVPGCVVPTAIATLPIIVRVPGSAAFPAPKPAGAAHTVGTCNKGHNLCASVGESSPGVITPPGYQLTVPRAPVPILVNE